MTKPNYVKRKEKEVLQVWDPLKKCLKLWLTCNLTVSYAEEYKNTSFTSNFLPWLWMFLITSLKTKFCMRLFMFLNSLKRTLTLSFQVGTEIVNFIFLPMHFGLFLMHFYFPIFKERQWKALKNFKTFCSLLDLKLSISFFTNVFWLVFNAFYCTIFKERPSKDL